MFFGFLLATIVAVPIDIACGLPPAANAGFNPLIQTPKPVSPQAWLPVITVVVSAACPSNDGLPSKSVLTSAITVTLRSLWPPSIDKDLANVGRARITKLALIFMGLRLSFEMGWMVLIAAEMLTQNPGLGKFVWDEFPNGSSTSLAKIMVAAPTIEIIGFALDRIMFAIRSLFTCSSNR